MKKIHAVILAGGKGSRLRPYTTILPKPLMPLGDYAIAEVVVRQLRFHGFRNIVISTGHHADLIQGYFGNGSKWGVHIKYVHEEKPLGTAGALRLVKNLDDHFLVINGDVLTDCSFSQLRKFHEKKSSSATITIRARKVKIEFGVIEADRAGALVDYIEKPEHVSYVSTGINMLSRKCVSFIKKDESIGMPELLLRLKDRGEKVFCYKTKALWLDLGRLDDFEQARDIFLANKNRFLK